MQSLRLLRLSAELEGRAATLRGEALQHMTIALASVDCRDFWKVLVTFFGSNQAEDPFQFLDGAPVIKRPLDLTDTDCDDDSSKVSEASTSSKPVAKKPAPVKPRNVTRVDLLENINETQGFLPALADTLHTTGIPVELHMSRSEHQTHKGASLYMCRHKDCSENPYLGDLPTCRSHIRRTHLGVCLLCPFCPNKRFYNSGGWRDHMSKKHPSAPWYGAVTAKESVQAQALLEALSTDPSAHIGSLEVDVSSVASPASIPSERIQAPTQEMSTDVQFPQTTQPKLKKQRTDPPLASSSAASTSKAQAQSIGHHDLAALSVVHLAAPSSLLPLVEEEPIDTLPYVPTEPEDDPYDPTRAPLSPASSDRSLAQAYRLPPSDLRQWDFTVGPSGQLASRYAKSKSQNPMTPPSVADIMAPELGSPSKVLPPPAAGELPLDKKRKKTTTKVWPEPDTHGCLIYRPPDQSGSGDDAPSMV